MVVTNTANKILFLRILLCASTLVASASYAAVLPEDRADILYHNYDGDDSTFKGPSVLIRKQFKETYSAWANYYIDINSAASIDVVTQGSVEGYEEERKEMSAGMDYLYDKTLLSASFTNSSENDYEADSFSLGVSQDFFGDMSTLTMNYAQGNDDIYQNIRVGPKKKDIVGRTFRGNAKHQRFAIGWTQIFTRDWIVAFNAEASADEGFLNNPYRSVRYISAGSGENIDIAREFEVYPGTRNSQAYAIKSMYYLPWRGGLKLEYRTFNDSWNIKASNYEIRYTHPYKEDWIFEVRYRHYDQTQASFYSDLFAFQGEFPLLASDKELSTFNNTTIGIGVTYELGRNWLGFFDRATLNLYADTVTYEYDNFSDKRESVYGDAIPGTESMFTFDALITRLFISVWY